MEQVFALYDSDVFYATRFMEYFRKKRDFSFDFSVFTRKESLIKFLQSNVIEILLVGDNITLEEIPMDLVRHIYKLSEFPCNKVDSEYPQIYKYQAAQAVMSEIVNDYFIKTDMLLEVNQSTRVKIISIFPLFQNVEALAYTLSLCSLLAEQRKVLLVMLETIPVPIIKEMINPDTNLTELIYYLKEYPNIYTKMKTLTKNTCNFACLSGLGHGLDIFAISKEDIQKWVSELRKYSDYQTVIFYLGGYMEAGNELLRLSDIVSIPIRETAYSSDMYKIMMKQTETSGLELKQNNIIKVTLQEEEELNQVPITFAELSHTLAWYNAKQNMDIYI